MVLHLVELVNQNSGINSPESGVALWLKPLSKISTKVYSCRRNRACASAATIFVLDAPIYGFSSESARIHAFEFNVLD